MPSTIYVMMSGLPGKMATLVAEKIRKIHKDTGELFLEGVGLTGSGQPDECKILNWTAQLKPPEKHEEYLSSCTFDPKENLRMIVDFSEPCAVNRNAELYCKHKAPFVTGTTGGDRKALEQVVKDSRNFAVIAPNMAKPIVLLQYMLENAAEKFPDALKGFDMRVVESHQDTKKDTSGTAKAMVSYFRKLGVPFTVEGIRKIRDRTEQKILLGVSIEHLGGHGWHTYTLKSEDETVKLQFTHNVNGRQVYADGAIDAIRFLAGKIKEGEPGVYSMIDVLKGSVD